MTDDADLPCLVSEGIMFCCLRRLSSLVLLLEYCLDTAREQICQEITDLLRSEIGYCSYCYFLPSLVQSSRSFRYQYSQSSTV